MTTPPLKLTRRGMLLALGAVRLGAQQLPGEGSSATPPTPAGPLDWYCPMDRDVRSDKPGVCPRCGMKLAFGIQEEIEYRMDLRFKPAAFRAGQKVQLHFQVTDPVTSKTVSHYEIVHERLFHMFIVSQDLEYFIHEHPVPQPDGTFIYDQIFPKPAMYRILGDFYPTGGTPQLIAKTVIVPGTPGQEVPLMQPRMKPELGVSHCENIDVELVTDPPMPIAGVKTLLFFKVSPAEGLERVHRRLGAHVGSER